MSKTECVLVTGGSTGIGASICADFLEQGMQVINLARRPLELENPAWQERLHNIAVDLTDREATKAVAEQVAEQFNVTRFVHNAGVIKANLIEDVALDELDYVSNIHLAATIILTQAVLPAMKEASFGRIILITSRAALGLQTRSVYSATKSGMMGMARTWALELGQYGITVNTVAPGPIAATEMFHEVIPENSEKMQKLAASIPVQRTGLPGDVSRAVSFFADEKNSFVTGQTLFVCGGSSLGSLSL
ncbi:MAG: SDR family oxidoreductase [Cellvibrionaceae bacterium]|nr:SDR family oxidoreductase [Cellvibrionaceae bacterium]